MQLYPSKASSPGLWGALKSALAALIGIQKQENRARDFQQGRPGHFILAGLIVTIVFICTLLGVVWLVLP